MNLITCVTCSRIIGCIIATKGFSKYEKGIYCKDCYLVTFAREQ